MKSSLQLACAVLLLGILRSVSAQSCGLLGQACCTSLSGARNACNAGMWCDPFRGNTCQYYCGTAGQPCCGGNYCSSGLFCQSGEGAEAQQGYCIENCGGEGQRCCRNYYCNNGFTCTFGLQCVRCSGCGTPSGCGNAGQPCCSGDVCNAGLFCDGNIQPGSKSCQNYCGGVSQRCCGGKNPGYDGCSRSQFVYCDAGTGLCTNFCGQEGQSCCPSGWCGDGLSCTNAVCQQSKACGAPGGGCCPDGTCGLLGYTCVTGSCKQTCGLPGQPCCARPSSWCSGGGACKNSTCAAPAVNAAATASATATAGAAIVH